MPAQNTPRGRLSLSVDLPQCRASSPTSPRTNSAQRLLAAWQKQPLPLTWVWSGNPPQSTTELAELTALPRTDLGWAIPVSGLSRQQYRAQILGWLKQWQAALKSPGNRLRMVVTHAGKVSIPYDALTRAGISVQRDGQLQSGHGAFSQPRWMHSGLWQLPLQAEMQLTQGWISSTAANWRLQGLLRQLLHSPGMHLHLRIDLGQREEMGGTVLANWEKLLHILAGFVQQGGEIDQAARICADLAAQHQRSAGSILRAA
ncbi:MAG: hypothetical protein SFX18_17035 [Pirellulales bacterium]|nr:hypothetical protein [Pirellulales bacterium]